MHFMEALKNIKTKIPLMIELGCAEAEYSKAFNDYFEGKCRNVCLDIPPRQIETAKQYFPAGEMIHGYVGAKVHVQENKEDDYGAPKIDMKDLIGPDNMVDILHMDIQGAEVQVSQELKEKNLYDFIDYLFLSFHQTQKDVMVNIPEYFEKIYNDPFSGGTGDGLLVARNPKYEGIK